MGTNQTLQRLLAWTLKSGVMLGGLTHPERLLVLGVPATCIVPGRQHTEGEVNAALRRCLAAEGAFLDTDHVELRRWLVDTGYLRRDGYGRAYERVPEHELAAGLREVLGALRGFDLPRLIGERRAAAAAGRASRRAAWEAARGARAGA